MTVSQKIGLALAEARGLRCLSLPYVDEWLSHRFAVPPGSLSEWERGAELPPSDILLSLLQLYNADVYRFMLGCGLEEMSQIGSSS